MKYKVLGIVVVLTLGLGYCTPQNQCSGFYQDPAICRGTKAPLKTVVVVNGQPKIIVGK